MPEVRLLCGAARSGRARAINDLAREHGDAFRILVPTRQYANQRTCEFVLDAGRPGCWGRPILTFNDFVMALLRAEGRAPVCLDDLERQLLLEKALRRYPAIIQTLGSVGETPGFHTQMLRVITQLKQAAVEPAAFRDRIAAHGHTHAFHAVVADAYAAYQDALREADVYDLPGLFWEADVLCRERRPALLDGVQMLLLDGFEDFTPSEFQLLLSLRERVQRMAFGIPCSQEPGQADLYALPLRTAERLARAFDAPIESFDTPAPVSKTDYAAQALFWRDKPTMPPGLVPNLRVASCADATDELEFIARRIKRLLANGHAHPGEVAVVFPSLAAVAAPLRAAFAEYGIPLRMSQQPVLWDSAVCGFVYKLLDATEEWLREPVADVLTAPLFRPANPHAAAVPYLSRLARVVAGADAWREHVDALIAGTGTGISREGAALRRHIDEPGAAVAALRAQLDCLDGFGGLLPACASFAFYAEAMQRLVAALGLREIIDTVFDADTAEREHRALDAFNGMLHAWRSWEDDIPPGSASLAIGSTDLSRTRADCLARLRSALQQTSFAAPQPRDAVACFDPASIRHLRFAHVFYGGLNEGAVPGPPPHNAIYSEQDITELARAGIELDSRRVHSERQTLLFHHVVQAAGDITLTWRRLDARAREQYPSPFLSDLRELFADAPVDETATPGAAAAAFVPPLEDAGSWRDIRNRLFFDGIDPPADVPPAFLTAREAARIESCRDSERPFDCYDGILAQADWRARCAAKFDAGHLFSVKQLETYLACPFRFFAERIIGIDDADIPEAAFDNATRGLIIHAALQRFHKRYCGLPVEALPMPEAHEALRPIVAAVFDEHAALLRTLPRGVLEVERTRIEIQLQRQLGIERDRNRPGWHPAHFEVAFGRPLTRFDDPLANPQPFVIETEQGLVRFTGRIDRIDRHDEAGSRIIDYKSGGMPAQGDITAGIALQLTVYAHALESHLLPGEACAEAWFVPVGRDEWTEVMKRDDKKCPWEQRLKIAEGAIARAVGGMRAGKFQPVPTKEACRHCDARRACRYQQGRIERKKKQDEPDPSTTTGD